MAVGVSSMVFSLRTTALWINPVPHIKPLSVRKVALSGENAISKLASKTPTMWVEGVTTEACRMKP